MTGNVRLLYGPYTPPVVRHGDVVFCEARGDVIVVGVTEAPIPWPVGKRGRARAPILFGDLVEAVRRESNQVVAHWWGVTPQIRDDVEERRRKMRIPFLLPTNEKAPGRFPGA